MHKTRYVCIWISCFFFFWNNKCWTLLVILLLRRNLLLQEEICIMSIMKLIYVKLYIVLILCLRKQVKHLNLWIFECRKTSHDAYMLGLSAAVLLGLSHVIANLLGRCNCGCSRQESQKASFNRQLSVACLILTWYFFY